MQPTVPCAESLRPTRIVAVDPGVTTGLAIYDPTLNTYTTLAIQPVTDVLAVVTLGYNCYTDRPTTPTVCVIEDFNTGGAISAHGLHTVRLIGAVEYACDLFDIPLFLQFPGERERCIQDARDLLAHMKPKHMAHDVDALAHLLLYQLRTANNQHPTGDRRTWRNSPQVAKMGRHRY